MNTLLNGDGEIALLCDDKRVVDFDGLEQWQIDHLIYPQGIDSLYQANASLQAVDTIIWDWLRGLRHEDWQKISRQRSLYGIKIPEKWIKVWRVILKEPNLRDSRRATRGGHAIGSYSHIWNVWSEFCIEQYLSDMEKELLAMVDAGMLYAEIGDILVAKYGDDFWKPRKEDTKTTPAQVVNSYLYWKMPNKIARAELNTLVRSQLRRWKVEQRIAEKAKKIRIKTK